ARVPDDAHRGRVGEAPDERGEQRSARSEQLRIDEQQPRRRGARGAAKPVPVGEAGHREAVPGERDRDQPAQRFTRRRDHDGGHSAGLLSCGPPHAPAPRPPPPRAPPRRPRPGTDDRRRRTRRRARGVHLELHRVAGPAAAEPGGDRRHEGARGGAQRGA
ncbi:MAG: hypothetical protein ACK559_04990, partial [bacterium]